MLNVILISPGLLYIWYTSKTQRQNQVKISTNVISGSVPYIMNLG